MKKISLVVSFIFIFLSLSAEESNKQLAGKINQILHIINYLKVDYPETVRNGKIIDEEEYKEQIEFAESLNTFVKELEKKPKEKKIDSAALQIEKSIQSKKDGSLVQTKLQNLEKLIEAKYKFTTYPNDGVNLEKAAKLYQKNCSSCHGVNGKGDGAMAKSLTPKPANFHDAERMNEQSIYNFYNTISIGLEGTSMAGFSGSLKDKERWAVATYITGFYVKDIENNSSKFSLEELFTYSPNLIEKLGKDKDDFIAARANPNTAQLSNQNGLDIAIEQIQVAQTKVMKGNYGEAYQHALNAYLEGFELEEKNLNNIDHELTEKIEELLYDFRDAVKSKAPADTVSRLAEANISYLNQAKERIEDTNLSPAVIFTSSLTILLREGLEAILILAVLFSLIKQANVRELNIYVHAGWIGALLLGALTWVAATFLFEISGASRELIEGLTAISAAIIVLWLGLWMHSKVNSKNWIQFIKKQLKGYLTEGRQWGLTVLAFIAVYREVFETILFYQALYVSSSGNVALPIFLGIGVAVLILLIISLMIFKFSKKVSIDKFFKINAYILFAISLVFIGKGIHALQEAGLIPISSLAFDGIKLIGIYPDSISLFAQVLLLISGLGYLLISKKRAS